MLPRLDLATCDALRIALSRADCATSGVQALLGPGAHAALGRGEPEPASRASADGGILGVLVRLLLLRAVESDAVVRTALAPLAPEQAAAAGLLRAVPGGWLAALDLRPYGEGGSDGDTAAGSPGAEWWVLSDLDGRRAVRELVRHGVLVPK